MSSSALSGCNVGEGLKQLVIKMTYCIARNFNRELNLEVHVASSISCTHVQVPQVRDENAS